MSVPPSRSPSLKTTSPMDEYDPEFRVASIPDFDVTLVSSDYVHFIISANILKSSSSVFADNFACHQPSGIYSRYVDLDEPAQTLRGLLRMISGKGLPEFETLDELEPLLWAAEKYDMPGPSSIMRGLLKSQHLDKEPMRLYLLGCQFEWDDIASLASRYSLRLDIDSDHSRSFLAKLKHVSDVLKIQELHQRRKDAIKELWIPDGPILKPYGPKKCTRWCTLPELRIFKAKIFEQIASAPAGILIFDEGLLGRYEAFDLAKAYCPQCNLAHVNVPKIISKMKERLCMLPDAI